MENQALFWQHLTDLVHAHPKVVDRPQGSSHPRYPDYIYPFDYGYLEGTRSGDGEGIDLWICEAGSEGVTGVILTVDLGKGDLEAKILLGCTRGQTELILANHNQGTQAGSVIMRPAD